MSVAIDPEIESLTIPAWVHDLPSFQRWVHSGVLPEKLKVHFINGQLWVDLSMEELISHNRLKTAICFALVTLIEGNDLGTYLSDGMRYTSESAGFSTEPDATYFSHETLARGDVEFRSGPKGKATEMLGTPDLVIEIVSRSTVRKDVDWLFENYFDAGIPEYWLIDAREEVIQFDIFKPFAKGYIATKKASGWLKSSVLGKSFKLIRTINPRSKLAVYQLEMR